MHSNKRPVFTGGACDEREARETVCSDRADRAMRKSWWGLKERVEEQKHKLGDTELEMEEADVP